MLGNSLNISHSLRGSIDYNILTIFPEKIKVLDLNSVINIFYVPIYSKYKYPYLLFQRIILKDLILFHTILGVITISKNNAYEQFSKKSNMSDEN